MSDRYFIPIPQLSKKHIKRFWSYVDKSPGQGPKGKCWMWIGGLSHLGYGRLRVGTVYIPTHRIAYALKHGSIPDGKRILHTCDIRACVRCIYAGTMIDNARDCINRGRTNRASGDRHGSRTHPECVLFGSTHPMSKINERDIRVIRKTKLTYKDLAEVFGISKHTVAKIKRREIWKHV